jgi:predicted O-methyltransferase YrrM
VTGGDHAIPEVMRLLMVLAAGRRVAEIGTAYGATAAAMAATAREVVTVEVDEERAEVAVEHVRDLPNVELLVGDWRDHLASRAPFELVFLDGGGAKTDPAAVELAAPGGIYFMDDFTPDWVGPDPVREFWAARNDVVVTEILTTPTTAALVAARMA